MIKVCNNSKTDSIKIMTVALLLANITTSAVGGNCFGEVNHRPGIIRSGVEIGEDTTTPNTKEIVVSEKTVYEKASEIIGGDIRSFSEEEAMIYNNALDKMYKPLDMDIMDLC